MAKSINNGNKISLFEHSQKTYNYLKKILEKNVLFDFELSKFDIILSIISLFHDVGKIDPFLQNAYYKDKEYNPFWEKEWFFRHEIGSCWILFHLLTTLNSENQKISNEELSLILMAIGFHHKSINDTNFIDMLKTDKYIIDETYSTLLQLYPIGYNYFQRLYNSIPELNKEIQQLLQIFNKDSTIITIKEYFNKKTFESTQIHPIITKLYEILRDYSTFDTKRIRLNQIGLITKGILNFCDYSASNLNPNLNFDYLEFNTSIQVPISEYLKLKNNSAVLKQIQVQLMDSSNLKEIWYFLEAPTGFGKTESALIWAMKMQSNIKNKRIFYNLPFTASINKMYNRFTEKIKEKSLFTKKQVEIYHHRAEEFRYEKMLELDSEDKVNKNKIVNFEIEEKVLSPVRILTPFQMIKALYGIGPYEKDFFEAYGGLIIFDEIDSYEIETLIRICGLIYFYGYYSECRFLFMSASLPKWLKWVIKKILDSCEHDKYKREINISFDFGYSQYLTWCNKKVNEMNEFSLTSEILQEICHHKIELKEGSLFEYILENLDSIIKLAETKKLMFVFNTVQESINSYQFLSSKISEENILLIHSKYMFRDRKKIEDGIENQNKKSHGILIGTQAIEVSLDIDYDFCFSDPAPIDRLIQRFGRVYRRRIFETNNDIPNAIIFLKQSSNAPIYDPFIIKNTIQCLKDIISLKNGIFSEETKKETIEIVYKEKAKEYMDELTEKLPSKFDYWRNRIVPGNKAKQNDRELFFKLFNTVEIIPESFLLEYEQLCQEEKYIEASEMEIGLSFYPKELQWNQIMKKYHLFEKSFGKNNRKMLVASSEEWNYTSNLGLERKRKNEDGY